MLFPVILSSHRRLIIVPEGWFSGIGSLDVGRNELTIGINPLGEGGLAWLVDSNGLFYQLAWQGRQSKKLGQFLGLSKQRERYVIQSGRQISAGELLTLIKDHGEQFAEVPNSEDLRKLLTRIASDEILQRNIMREYFGEQN